MTSCGEGSSVAQAFQKLERVGLSRTTLIILFAIALDLCQYSASVAVGGINRPPRAKVLYRYFFKKASRDSAPESGVAVPRNIRKFDDVMAEAVADIHSGALTTPTLA